MNPQPTPPTHNNPSDQFKTTSKRDNSPSPIGEGVRGPACRKFTEGRVRNDRLLQDIINYLRLHHNLHSAFLLSKHTHTTTAHHNYPPPKTNQNRQFTYTLVTITNPSQNPPPLLGRGGRGVRIHQPNPAALSDTLHNHTAQQARVYVIPFTKSAVIKKMHFGSNFLTHILNHTPCLYTLDDTWQQFKNYTPLHHKTVGEAIQNHWDTRYKRADYLLEIGGTIDADQEPMACFEIFNHALTQTCLGLIYVHWEYKPSYTALPYLLHLCSLITPLPNEVFPNDNYRARHLLHHLCHARTNLIHKTKPKLTLNDIEKAWRKCDHFLNQARELVKDTMNKSPHNWQH